MLLLLKLLEKRNLYKKEAQVTRTCTRINSLSPPGLKLIALKLHKILEMSKQNILQKSQTKTIKHFESND